MAEFLQIKIFTNTDKAALEVAINNWMKAESVATQHYLDMTLNSVLIEAAKKNEPTIQYTAMIIYRK